MDAALYTRITEAAGVIDMIDGLYDTKLPDEYALDRPVIVLTVIDDVPTKTIDGAIVLTERRVQCSVLAQDLDDARAVKAALIAALQCWRGDAGLFTYESGGPELYDSDMNPPSYQVSCDFMQTF